jgi:hypothetical protein
MESFRRELERLGLIDFYQMFCPVYDRLAVTFEKNKLLLPKEDSKLVVNNESLVEKGPYDWETCSEQFFKGLRRQCWI